LLAFLITFIDFEPFFSLLFSLLFLSVIELSELFSFQSIISGYYLLLLVYFLAFYRGVFVSAGGAVGGTEHSLNFRTSRLDDMTNIFFHCLTILITTTVYSRVLAAVFNLR